MPTALSNFSPPDIIYSGNTWETPAAQRTGLFICNSGDYPIEVRPDLLRLAMRIISAWSILDSYVARAFAAMLGKNDNEPAIAMYESLGSQQVRHGAILAAAKTILPLSRYLLLEALLNIYAKRSKIRNRIAHHLWGYSSSAPNGVCLMDPKDFFSADRDNFPFDKVSVYTEQDFNEGIVAIEEMCLWFHRLYFLVGPWEGRQADRRAAEILQQLINEPPIQKALCRIIRSRNIRRVTQ